MRNVSELLQGAERKSQVLIFGRRDTLETAYLVLDEFGLTPSQAVVAPLSYEQSCLLVEGMLDTLEVNGRPFNTHRVHQVPFGEFRDRTLLDMARALGNDSPTIRDAWDDSGEFLGYPPVILVLARYLQVDNPAAAVTGVSSPGGGNPVARGDLLLEVVNGILDRESEKVRLQMAPALHLNEADPKLSVVYTREEQVLRLLGFLADMALDVALPATLANGERAVYEEQVGGFLPDHPFLDGRTVANVVFEDYLQAFVVTAPTQGLALNTAVHKLRLSVGPFFAHFVSAMSESGSGDVALVAEDVVDRLIKSYESSSNDPAPFVYSFSPRGATLVLSEDAASSEKLDSALVFLVERPSGILLLTSPVSRGLVVCPEGGVSVTSSTDEVILGPEFILLCEDLQLDGKRLSILSSPLSKFNLGPAGGVHLIVKNSVEHDPELRIHAQPADTLSISWKNPSYQWRPFVASVEPTLDNTVDSQKSWQVMFGLRRLLSAFHSSAANDPSLYHEYLHRFAVGSNPIFSASLEGLIELNVIRREGTLYRLNLERLAGYGINYAALRGSNFAKVLQRLHADVCKTNVVWQALSPDA
jgi:hypothetical protein